MRHDDPLTRALAARLAGILLVLFVWTTAPAQQIPRCEPATSLAPKAGCLTVEYDRFKDSTMAALQFTVVDKGANKRIVVMLMSSYEGDSPAGKDRTYALAIASVGLQVEPSRVGRQLEVLIDGTVRSTITLIATKATQNASGVSAEQLLSMVTKDDLTRLSRANTLEMRLGQDEFAFDDAMRKNLWLFWGDYVVLVH
jgi:hypothetical protein